MFLVDKKYRSRIIFPTKKLQILLNTTFFLYICHTMNIQNKRIFASILFVLISFVCVAQRLPEPAPPPPVGVPIDGGVIIGAFVAIFYGVKKIVSNK